LGEDFGSWLYLAFIVSPYQTEDEKHQKQAVLSVGRPKVKAERRAE
jgi:hypothetical protein